MKNDLTVLNQFEEVTHDELLEVDGGFVITIGAATITGKGAKWAAGLFTTGVAVGAGVAHAINNR